MDKPKCIEDVLSLRTKITNIDKQIEYYELMANTLGGPNYDSERIDKTRNLDAPFVKWIFKKLDAEDIKKKLLDQLDEKLKIAIDEINKLLSIDEKTILTLRYVQNLSWEKIAEKTYFSRTSIFRFHRNGLENLIQSKVGT